MYHEATVRYVLLEGNSYTTADMLQTGEVLVACEGVPAVFSFKISASATSGTALALHGNALNVAVLHTSQTLSTVVVTIDHVHKPGSTKEVREERVSRCHGLVVSRILIQFTEHSPFADILGSARRRMAGRYKCFDDS